MCLGVPGKIISVDDPSGDGMGRTGMVDFQGSQVQAGLMLLPDADVGDWVLVHAGFAITKLDEAEAKETWEYLREAGIGGLDAV